MKTICFYGVSSHFGGAERSLFELASGLKKFKTPYEPWLILPASEGPLVTAARQTGIRVDILPFPRGVLEMSRLTPASSALHGILAAPSMGAYLGRLTKLLKKNSPAILHTSGLKCHALGAAAGSLSGTPVLWHLRDIFDKGATRTALRAIASAFSPSLVANSHATANAFITGGKVSVVYNGLDPDFFFAKHRKTFQDLIGVPNSTPVIGIVGVLARWKGQSQFLRMARQIIDEDIDAAFAVIGGEIYDTRGDRGFFTELRQEARDLGIDKRVHFTGFQNDVASAINSLDVLVHASTRPEPFGRVVVEGFACQVPVAASGAGGVTELIADGKSGLLYEPGDIAGMASCVKRLLFDPELRDRLVATGDLEFRKRFTQETHVRNMVRIFDDITGHPRRRSGAEEIVDHVSR